MSEAGGREDLWSVAWHTRRNGLVQGPFSLAQMRRMRNLGWLSSVDQVSVDMLRWRPGGDFKPLWNNDPSPEDASPPEVSEPWRWMVNGREAPERVTFAMLQVIAASGALTPGQFVWREGMTDWRPAGSVRGLFGGPTDWCPGCDSTIPRDVSSCPACGWAQRPYEPSHRDIIVPCGVLGVCLFPLVPLWIIAIMLARRDRWAIDLGRVDPAGLEWSRIGEILGWMGCLLTVATAFAAAAWFALSA